MKLRLSKSAPQRGVAMGAPLSMPAMMPAAPAPAMPAAAPAAGDAAPAAPAAAGARSDHLEVKSAMVGTFYKSPEPGAKPYVSAGDRIAKGQVLCIIEAMKIMNEIESEFAGVVVDVVADDAHPVEYGQVLFRIDPNG
jgi:acetyl-CoA carboxylase biotin carboxyl carrier protein